MKEARVTDPSAFRAVRGVPTTALGEGPWWDDQGGHLFWVDIAGRRIHRWSPAKPFCDTHVVDDDVGFALLELSGDVVAGIGNGIYRFTFGAPEHRVLARPVMHHANRFNDAACDPRGRLWAGTMHRHATRDLPATGALYRLTAEGLDIVEGDIAISNGLGWSPGGDTMYFADTHRGVVWAYDYRLADGTSGGRRVFAEVSREIGVPDGLTVDSAGYVYVAIWRGGRINVHAPDGQLDQVITTPVRHPTSCCFGGADLKTLFVTTARNGLTAAEAAQDEMSGLLFSMPACRPGMASARVDLPRDRAI